MRLLDLYTRITGRISRRTWWLGAIGLALAYLVLRQPLRYILQFEPATGATGDLVSLAWVTDESSLLYAFAHVALSAVVCFMGYCLSVKRRHDRNAAGWDVAVLFGAPVALGLLQLLAPLLPAGDSVPTGPSGVSVALLLVSGYIYQPFALYVIVVLGLLKGSVGANNFGPDPLIAAVQSAATEEPS